ncbi:MAG: filamentous hemagglutinin N-terminal domain-containing protein [Phormidesmis sp.]
MLLRFSIFWATLIGLETTAKGESIGVYPDDTTQTHITGSIACASSCDISGGMRVGDGLFHSFREFSIPENATATFSDGGATNIFARVSDVASVINGEIAIQETSNANFFLINPNGITFGANSSLSLQGSFTATTANSIRFPNEVQFSAVEDDIPLLAVTTPIGLQFGTSPSPIVNQSRANIGNTLNTFGQPVGLQVMPGQTISLFGGGVDLRDGNITANSGRVFIGSVGPESQVRFSSELVPAYHEGVNFQDINLTQRAIIDSSGSGGQVLLQGQNISILDDALIANAAIDSLAISEVKLIADDLINISGFGIYFVSLPSPSTTKLENPRFGTNLNTKSTRLILDNGAFLSGGTFGESNGGTITINATESVALQGRSDFIPSLISTSTDGSGRGGDINLRTERLFITHGSQIQALTTGTGESGAIRIVADEQVDIAGFAETPIRTFFSGIVASSGAEGFPFSTGKGGNLKIRTDRIRLSNRAQVAVNSFGIGDSGDIEINARSVQLVDNAQLTAAAAFENGGNIVLNDLETLLLRRGSRISTQAGTQGNNGDGGNISISADFVVSGLSENSDIVANARQGRGGNITINARGLYGIEERRAIANNQTNDIDASSEFGISGTSTINRIVSDAETAPSNLTRDTLETSTEVSQRCAAVGNRFVRVGRGGIPRQANGAASLEAPLVDLGEEQTWSHMLDNATDEAIATTPSPIEVNHRVLNHRVLNHRVRDLVEASAWHRDHNNQIKLVAQAQQEPFGVTRTAQCTGR